MRILGRLLKLAGEQDCRLCGAATIRPICSACDADLPRLPSERCPVCALPSPGAQTCGRCLAATPAYDATTAAFQYAFPVTRLIQSFKYEHAVGLGMTLASCLADAIAAGDPQPVDLLVPLPLVPARLKERGYNQALELARVLASRHRLQLDARAVARVRNTPPQAELPWKERRRNIRGAFAAQRRLDGCRIAVIDDVMTTGATLDEMARVLKAAGAQRVVNWVVARTLPRSTTHMP